jgi:hypothetical protein
MIINSKVDWNWLYNSVGGGGEFGYPCETVSTENSSDHR